MSPASAPDAQPPGATPGAHDAAVGESVFAHEGIAVRYKQRSAGGDRRHLVVVFAGIKQDGDYDFDGPASSGIKASMLWIADDVDGVNTYYMSHKGDLSVSDAVDRLITSRLDALGLTREQCTLMGFSKGASAALYIGLKYDYPNILASVPQIKVGSFTRDTYPDIFAHMTPTGSVADCVTLNELIPSALANDQQLAKNIYLISSVADSQFGFHIRPYVAALTKYENFNMVMTNSPQVTQHGEVTHYNVPVILSVLYGLSDGLAPRYGLVSNGSREPFDYAEII